MTSLILTATLLLAGCSTAPFSQDDQASGASTSPKTWAAKVSLNPSGNGAFVLGWFETEGACHDAVREWKSRQVVGNPLYGVCDSSADDPINMLR